MFSTIKFKMMKKYALWISAIAVMTLQSCSVKTETTYYKDSASSMESNILMDKSMLGMMNMMGDKKDILQNSKELAKLTTDWKSLYDLQKEGIVTLNKDSVKVLQKMFMKVNKDKGEIYGISLKYDKLLPSEVTSVISKSKNIKNIPLLNIGKWDGKTLTINTDQFNSAAFLSQIEGNADKNVVDIPKRKVILSQRTENKWRKECWEC